MAGPGRGDDRAGPPGTWRGRAGPWEEGRPEAVPWQDGRPGPGAGQWDDTRAVQWEGQPVRQPAFQPFQQPEEDGATRLVRPYTVTGGRTQPRYKLAVEALVTATVYEPRDLSVLAPECQAILQFCRDWRSVAEISAVLRIPLGVARILVADMGADGLVRIDQRDDAEGRPDLNLLERVLSGLRKI